MGQSTEFFTAHVLAVFLEHLGDLPRRDGVVEGPDAEAELARDAEHGLHVLGLVAVVVHGDLAPEHGRRALELQLLRVPPPLGEQRRSRSRPRGVRTSRRGRTARRLAPRVLPVDERPRPRQPRPQHPHVAHARVAVGLLRVLPARHLHVPVPCGAGRDDAVLEEHLLDDELPRGTGPDGVLDHGALAAHDVGAARDDEARGDPPGGDAPRRRVVGLHGVDGAHKGRERAKGLVHLVAVLGRGEARPGHDQVVRVHVDQPGRHVGPVEGVFAGGGALFDGGGGRDGGDEAPGECDVHGAAEEAITVEQRGVPEDDGVVLAPRGVPSRVLLAVPRLEADGHLAVGGTGRQAQREGLRFQSRQRASRMPTARIPEV